MKPTFQPRLVRPWKKFKDGTLFYGLSKQGSKRHPLTTKDGNKTFYKGTRSSGIGHHTKWGGYVIDWSKVRTYVVPEYLQYCELKPLVDPNVIPVKHDFSGTQGPTDAKYYFAKVQEFIEYGDIPPPDIPATEWKEKA